MYNTYAIAVYMSKASEAAGFLPRRTPSGRRFPSVCTANFQFSQRD